MTKVPLCVVLSCQSNMCSHCGLFQTESLTVTQCLPPINFLPWLSELRISSSDSKDLAWSSVYRTRNFLCLNKSYLTLLFSSLPALKQVTHTYVRGQIPPSTETFATRISVHNPRWGAEIKFNLMTWCYWRNLVKSQGLAGR